MNLLKWSLLLLCLLAPKSADLTLEIGTPVPENLIPKNSHDLLMTHCCQLDPFFDYSREGIKYTVGFGNGDHKISFVETHDAKFKTADGLMVGQVIVVTKDQALALPGWISFGLTTKDGWAPEIGFVSKLSVVRTEKGIQEFKAKGQGSQLDMGEDPAEAFKNSDTAKVIVSGFAKYKGMRSTPKTEK